MAKKGNGSRKGVLGDHKREGKRFVPPFTAALGPLREVSWRKRILPELVWIALVHESCGLRSGVTLARGLAAEARSHSARARTFGSVTSFSQLTDDDATALRLGLSATGALFELQRGIAPLVGLYPECPLRVLFSAPPAEEPRQLALMRSVVAELTDRNAVKATWAQATFLSLLFDAGTWRVKEELVLADFPLVEDYPLTERSRQVASSVRAATTTMFADSLYDANAPWPAYFWNRGLVLTPCTFNE